MNRLLALSTVLAALLGGCNYSNPHGSQELPPVKRLSTEPSGLTAVFVRTNLQYETPCDLPENVYEGDTVIIRDGNRTLYEGPLSDLPQVARGNYRFKR